LRDLLDKTSERLWAFRYTPIEIRLSKLLERCTEWKAPATISEVARVLNGQQKFLGRLDHQVKLRGYRIDLGEVEHALLAQPSVAQAVAVIREDRPGDQRLVAYVVRTPEAISDETKLEAALRQVLPAYMVPSAIVALTALPVTPNGKVDRRALPAPTWQSERAVEYVAPRTPVEDVLCGIWAEVLGLERVGVTDDFFALGGHSLLATQVVARVRTVLGLELPLRLLFGEPTPGELASFIAASRDNLSLGMQTVIPALPRGRQSPISAAGRGSVTNTSAHVRDA